MDNYLNKLIIENIDGAVKQTKLHNTDIISNNLLSSFSRSCSLQKLHIKVSKGRVLAKSPSQIELRRMNALCGISVPDILF